MSDYPPLLGKIATQGYPRAFRDQTLRIGPSGSSASFPASAWRRQLSACRVRRRGSTTPSACFGRLWRAGLPAVGRFILDLWARKLETRMVLEFARDLHVYQTRRGVQLCADSRAVLRTLPADSVDLIVTSPPFALLRQKSYGNESQSEYSSRLAASCWISAGRTNAAGRFVPFTIFACCWIGATGLGIGSPKSFSGTTRPNSRRPSNG